MPTITQTCRVTGKQFAVSEWEQEFLKKMGVPLPTICIEERHRRRLAHRNERSIYKDKCDLTGKSIISLFSADKAFKVYSPEAWHSDKWDPRDYGRDFDFNRPFFEQFYDLQKAVPHLALFNLRGENSEYCNITNSNKNCYLVFGGDYCEDCLYSVFSMYCKNSSDLYWVNHSELTYDCVDCQKCYNVKYSQNAENCRDSAFLFDCKNVQNCFGCVGLRNKEYHIFNQPYSAEEYAQKIKEYRLDTWSGVQHMKKEFDQFKLNFPHRDALIINSENVTGDQITNAKNCENCFDISGPAENMKDVIFGGWEAHDIVSCDHAGFKSDLFYEMVGSIEGHNCAFSTFAWTSQNIFYSDMIMNSHDLFGCSNMNRAQYCILNKQYSKEDYHELRARIVERMKQTGEWGEFFPMKDSMYAYNETVANDFFPLTGEQAIGKGLNWHEEKQPSGLPETDLQDSIQDVQDDVLEKTLICEKTGQTYRIITQELKLYRQLEIPIPRYAPETRNKLRFAKRNPRKLWDRECANCGTGIQTTYSPERPERVYCEKCYLKEVY